MSFQISLSGINAAFNKLKTTANNIANASTTGFKKSRTETADVNGGGVRVTQVARQHLQGNIEFTDNSLDMAINGNGFFALSDGGSAAYSRSGAFHIDRDGYLVNSENRRLQGFLADASGNITGTQGDVKLAMSSGQPAATSSVELGLNLDATETVPTAAFSPTDPNSYNHSLSMTVYDSLGNDHQMSFYFNKTATPGEWNVRTYQGGTEVLSATSMQFSSTGSLVSPPSGSISIPSFNPGGGAANLNINLDVSNTTQYGNDFSANRVTQDGYATGSFDGFAVSASGVVSARYTNGQTRSVAQVALADFQNPQGLQSQGNSTYGDNYGAGDAFMGAPSTGSFGSIQSGALEQSNSDIAEQLIANKQAALQAQANVKALQAESDMLGSLFKDKA